MTFAQRLKLAIEKLGISQAEAAKRCGVTQQSINYIINKNLDSSKMGTQIAQALSINADWLIFGRGKFEETLIFEIPILQSIYMIKKFVDGKLEKNLVEYTVIDTDLGDMAFAFLVDANKMVICADKSKTIKTKEYLTVDKLNYAITESATDASFPIFEWRTRHVDFE